MNCKTLHIEQEKSAGEIRTIFVIALTVITMIAEIVAGLAFGSIALLSDGIHMGTHTLALLITVIAYVVARKNATNSRFSFGTGKVGVLGGYTSAIALLIAAGFMVVEAVERLIKPVDISFNESIIVAIVGLLVNIASAFLLKDDHHHGHDHGHNHDHHDHDHEHHHDHDHNHEHHHDHNLRAAYLHVIADALTSVLAIGALLAGKYVNAVWLDPVVGIVGAVVITKWGVGLLKSTGAVLLDYSDNEKRIAKVTETVSECESAEITDLHVWQVSSGKFALMVSVENAGECAEELQATLENLHGYCHITAAVS